MFPGVHWSWKLWEVIVRRVVAAPEAEWKSGAGGGCRIQPMLVDCQLVSGQEFHNRHFLPALFHHLSYFCQYETKKNSTSVKILHIKCIPLTTLHKMWSQFLFLFLSMKVEPGSLTFCVMERSKFVALFPFSTPPAQAGARCPQNPPKSPDQESQRGLTAGRAEAVINCWWCHCWVMKPWGDKYKSYKISFKIQTRSGLRLCGFFPMPPPPRFMLSGCPLHFLLGRISHYCSLNFVQAVY